MSILLACIAVELEPEGRCGDWIVQAYAAQSAEDGISVGFS